MRPSFERFREDVKGCPLFIVEALIGNVVVGEMTYETARSFAWAIRERAKREAVNANGDGI